MASLNESTMSSKAFEPGGDSVSRNAGWHRTALMVAAWFEIIVGASFILATNAQSQLVFGVTPDALGALLLRFAGIALISLGIACLPSRLAGMQQSAVRALFIFNVAVTIFFAWVGVVTSFRGVMLCPVVMMHAVIAIALAASLRHQDV